jgi:hypothetical protein
MGFVPAPNTMQVNVRGYNAAEVWENVYFYTTEGEYDFNDEANQVAEALVDNWDTNIQNAMNTAVQLSSIYVVDASDQFGPVLEYTTGLPLAGLAAVDPLPFQDAVVVKKVTNNRGKSYRGRMYLTGWGEGGQAGSVWNASTLTYVTNYVNGMRVITTAEHTWTMAVVSKVAGGVERAEALITKVTGFSIDSIVASQRRRLPRRGA